MFSDLNPLLCATHVGRGVLREAGLGAEQQAAHCNDDAPPQPAILLARHGCWIVIYALVKIYGPRRWNLGARGGRDNRLLLAAADKRAAPPART